MSRDTWAYDYQNPVELNRYVYTANNPATMVDPTGYFGLRFAIGIGVAVTAVGILATNYAYQQGLNSYSNDYISQWQFGAAFNRLIDALIIDPTETYKKMSSALVVSNAIAIALTISLSPEDDLFSPRAGGGFTIPNDDLFSPIIGGGFTIPEDDLFSPTAGGGFTIANDNLFPPTVGGGFTIPNDDLFPPIIGGGYTEIQQTWRDLVWATDLDINSRKYATTDHFWEELNNEGLSENMVKDAIANGQSFPDEIEGRFRYDITINGDNYPDGWRQGDIFEIRVIVEEGNPPTIITEPVGNL